MELRQGEPRFVIVDQGADSMRRSRTGKGDEMRKFAAVVASSFAVLAVTSLIAEAAPRSGSGPRTARGGVEFAPVDRLGPTLPADNMLTPDSGWNGSSSGGVFGPNYSSAEPLFPPPAPPPPVKRRGYIILKSGGGQ